eukprot:scaffold41689_cov19-Tisochrysis_lutea.AAC.4
MGLSRASLINFWFGQLAHGRALGSVFGACVVQPHCYACSQQSVESRRSSAARRYHGCILCYVSKSNTCAGRSFSSTAVEPGSACTSIGASLLVKQSSHPFNFSP